jgi:hypothetical protein
VIPVLHAALGALQSLIVSVAEQDVELPHPSLAVNTVVKVPGPELNGPNPLPNPAVVAVTVNCALQSVTVGIGMVKLALQVGPSIQTTGMLQLVMTGATKSTTCTI